jgi:hypothetical protein
MAGALLFLRTTEAARTMRSQQIRMAYGTKTLQRMTLKMTRHLDQRLTEAALA